MRADASSLLAVRAGRTSGRGAGCSAGRARCGWRARGRQATEAGSRSAVVGIRRRHVEGSGCCVLCPACGPCQRRRGRIWPTRRAVVRWSMTTWWRLSEPVGFGVDDAVWDVAPWLEDLREVPAEAVWPRLMTVPHPAAVGSSGGRVRVVGAGRTGCRVALVAAAGGARLLEVDADGRLVWLVLLLTWPASSASRGCCG